MKVSLPWHIREENQDLTDEYNITFVNKPNNFDNLIEFLIQYPDKRFNITVDTENYQFDYNKFKVLNSIHKNVYLVIPFHIYPRIQNIEGLKFYFDPSMPIDSFRLLEYVASLGVTDIYIADDLCYNLEMVRRACNKYNIRTRLIINRIPSSRPDKGIDPRSPWFIPETIDELAKYIDTIEFEGGNSWARLEVLYKIWFKKKEWRENLRKINIDLDMDIWNQCMIPNFTIKKMNCRYRCAYGSACKQCNQFVEMAEDLYNKNIEYTPLREKEGK